MVKIEVTFSVPVHPDGKELAANEISAMEGSSVMVSFLSTESEGK